MGDYKRDSEQDNSRDCPIPGTEGYSDEELLKEFEAVKRMTVPLPIPDPPPDEFEKIWARIQEERAESRDSSESGEPEHPKVIRPRFGWRRLAAIGLIACLVAGSGCMVAMGTKSYFYRGKELGDGRGKVFVNDLYKVEVNGEEEAYTLIEQELGIKPLKLGYVPSDMVFEEIEVKDGYAAMKFSYNERNVYFVQTKYKKNVSYNYDSDKEEGDPVKNRWLNTIIDVCTYESQSGLTRYESSMVVDGIYYRLWGTIDKQEFKNIVERLSY